MKRVSIAMVVLLLDPCTLSNAIDAAEIVPGRQLVLEKRLRDAVRELGLQWLSVTALSIKDTSDKSHTGVFEVDLKLLAKDGEAYKLLEPKLFVSSRDCVCYLPSQRGGDVKGGVYSFEIRLSLPKKTASNVSINLVAAVQEILEKDVAGHSSIVGMSIELGPIFSPNSNVQKSPSGKRR